MNLPGPGPASARTTVRYPLTFRAPKIGPEWGRGTNVIDFAARAEALGGMGAVYKETKGNLPLRKYLMQGIESLPPTADSAALESNIRSRLSALSDFIAQSQGRSYFL